MRNIIKDCFAESQNVCSFTCWLYKISHLHRLATSPLGELINWADTKYYSPGDRKSTCEGYNLAVSGLASSPPSE